DSACGTPKLTLSEDSQKLYRPLQKFSFKMLNERAQYRFWRPQRVEPSPCKIMKQQDMLGSAPAKIKNAIISCQAAPDFSLGCQAVWRYALILSTSLVSSV